MNFKDLGLSEKTVKAIEELGITEPTTVQNDVIPSILQGKDIFTIAPQGCGKTCSYVFPLLDIISKANDDHKAKGPNILIITPDSNQSVVVSDQLALFNKYHEINESTLKDRDEDVDSEANVIIASPDLLLDLMDSQKIDLSNTNKTIEIHPIATGVVFAKYYVHEPLWSTGLRQVYRIFLYLKDLPILKPELRVLFW